MLKKIEYIARDNQVCAINNPELCYTYIYAPKATRINVKSVDTIFCGPDTKVDVPCTTILRGQWYIKDGCVRSKTDNGFKYDLTFNTYSMNGGIQSDKTEEMNGFPCGSSKIAGSYNNVICNNKANEENTVTEIKCNNTFCPYNTGSQPGFCDVTHKNIISPASEFLTRTPTECPPVNCLQKEKVYDKAIAEVTQILNNLKARRDQKTIGG